MEALRNLCTSLFSRTSPDGGRDALPPGGSRRSASLEGGRLALHGALLGVATVLIGCGGPSDTGEVEFRIPVEVVEIGTGDVEDLVLTTGTLRPPEVVTLNIEAPGYLQIGRDSAGDRLVEGAQVTQGKTIAQVTGEDARLHARIESTRRTLSNAGAELERRRELFEGGLVAEEELRQSEVAYENALYEFERSKLNASKATLVTPIDGVLLTLARNTAGLPLADGQLVAPGFQVARIAALERLIADVDLVGPELAKVRPGLDVRVRHYAFAAADLTGKVLRLSPEMNATTHTFRAEVAVDNQAQLLRPGIIGLITVPATPGVVVGCASLYLAATAAKLKTFHLQVFSGNPMATARHDVLAEIDFAKGGS